MLHCQVLRNWSCVNPTRTRISDFTVCVTRSVLISTEERCGLCPQNFVMYRKRGVQDLFVVHVDLCIRWRQNGHVLHQRI